MKKELPLNFSKEILKDMTLIADYKGIKLSDWIKRLNVNFEISIQKKKAFTIKKLEGLWVLGKMTDSEFKRITGKPISKAMLEERAMLQDNSYRENARKALMINLEVLPQK